MSSDFHRYRDRHESFCRVFNVQGKRCTWPYRVIPAKAMAQLGFEYQPTFIGEAQCRDYVSCCYCGLNTYNFHECRAKALTLTLSKVLEKHLRLSPGCLNSALKLVLMRSYYKAKPIDWSMEAPFSDPHSEDMISLRQWTFNEGWSHSDQPGLSTESMAKAGLSRYDLGLPSSELQEDHNDTTYCVYCSKIIGSWEVGDDPIWEHFVCCNGGNCHFFETMPNQLLLESLKAKLMNSSLSTDVNTPPSLDYYEMFGSLLKRFEEQTTVEESVIKRGRPRSSHINELPHEPRKRGRPKKQRTVGEGDHENSTEGAPQSTEKEVVVKRKRGRPKKIIDESSAEIKPKRPRGRPKKDAPIPITQSIKLLKVSEDLLSQGDPEGANIIEPFADKEQSNLSGNPPKGSSSLNSDFAQREISALPFAGKESSTSPRRRIKLRTNSKTPMLAEDELNESDTNSTKSIIVNFKPRSPQKEDTARNPIIDDSFDAFSFSAHGNSEFIIPENAFQLHLNKKESSAEKFPSTPVKQALISEGSVEMKNPSGSHGKSSSGILDKIDMDVEISDSSDDSPRKNSSKSEGSSPIHTPVHRTEESPEKSSFKEDKLSSAGLLSENASLPTVKPSSVSVNDDEHQFFGVGLLENYASNTKGTNKVPQSPKATTVSSRQHFVNDIVPEKKTATFPIEQAPGSQPFSIGSGSAVLPIPNEESTTIFKETLGPEAATIGKEYSLSKPTERDSGQTGNSSRLEKSLNSIDEDRRVLSHYFHNLLRYINLNDASLANEADGDLNFFVKHMPEDEKRLSFTAWLDEKVVALKEEFNRDYKLKIVKLEEQFQSAQTFVRNLDSEEALLRIAKEYNIDLLSPSP